MARFKINVSTMRKEIPLEQVSVGNLSMLENKMKKT